MDAWTRNVWAKTRRIGRGNFILLGAIAYSVLACLLFALTLEWLAIRVQTLFAVGIVLGLIAFGPLWSHSVWLRMEQAWQAEERGRNRRRAH